MEGYVKIWRRYFASASWLEERKFSRQEAWLDLVAMASFADRVVQLGEGREIALYKGEILASQRQLAKRWGWSAATVNRWLKGLSSGPNPQIECYTRRVVVILTETPSETPSETPTETEATIIKLSEYASCEIKAAAVATPNETPNETPTETIYNKDIEEGNMISTHSMSLYKFFERARAMRTPEDARDMAELAQQAEREVATLPEAREHFNRLTAAEKGLLWVWRKYPELMRTFSRPCTLADIEQLHRGYEFEDMQRVIEAMANKLPARSSRLGSFMATFKQWASLDHRIRKKAQLGNPRYANYS